MNSQSSPAFSGADSASRPFINPIEINSGTSWLKPAIPVDSAQGSVDPTKSKANFHQHPGLPGEVSSRSLYQGSERPVLDRKKTPARAVFHDLPTAHSSITSKSAKSRHQPVSQNAEAAYDDEDENSIPLQDLEKKNVQDDLSFLPVRPPPVAMSSSKPLHQSTNTGQPALASVSLHAGNTFTRHEGEPIASKAVPYKPSEEAKGDRSNLLQNDSSIYPSNLEAAPALSQDGDHENRMEVDIADFGTCTRVGDNMYQSLYDDPESEYNESIFDKKRTPRLRKFSDARSGPYNSSSLRDGSTIGNIYRHYMHDGDPYESSDDEHSEPGLPDHLSRSRDYWNDQASGHGFPSSPISSKMKRSLTANLRGKAGVEEAKETSHGYAPKFALLNQSKNYLAVQHVTPSTSQGVGHSSSYGDTRNLLELAQGTHSTKHKQSSSPQNGQLAARSGLPSEQALLHLKKKHPFAQRPQVIISPADNDSLRNNQVAERSNVQDRLPLEREVSKALRRASGYSTYSNGSIQSQPDRYCDLPSETSTYKAIQTLLRRNVEITPPSDTESVKRGGKVMPFQARGFYDQQAIGENWATTRQQNVVRVPINHNGSFPDSPPESFADEAESPVAHQNSTLEEDLNDWETVGDSLAGMPPLPEFFGGTVRRAGSSIANHSDDGSTISPIPEIDSFSSTERITQHPGNIEYSGDYRQRDLKKSRIPVILPVFNEHKVNGYLSDSTRIRPVPNPFKSFPRPLLLQANPFKSTPAKVTSTTPVIKPQHQQSYYFPPNTKNGLPYTREERDIADEKSARLGRQRGEGQRSSRDSSWMDDFGEPGPMITTTQSQFHGTYQPNDNSLATNNLASYRNHHRARYTPQENHYANDRILEWQSKSEIDAFGLRDSQRRDVNEYSKQSRDQLVKGPPGAFYQGVRSGQDTKPATWAHRENRPSQQPRGSIRDLPTNALRPLSLLSGRRPSTPIEQIIPDPSKLRNGGFVYRSPLAPPKRYSWQQLYNPSQMRKIHEAARADGLFSSQQSIPGGSKTKIVGAQKHLYEAPRLTPFQRESPDEAELIQERKKISTVALVVCATFPPLLLLYAIGTLDGLMCCWTKGQCSSFEKRHKRIAYIMITDLDMDEELVHRIFQRRGMFSSSVRKVASTVPSIPIASSFANSAPRATASKAFSYRSHQRRYSSSKPSSPADGSKGVAQGQSVPTTPAQARPDGEKKTSRSSRKKARDTAAAGKAQEDSLHNLPKISASDFFSLHRPISLTNSFPKTVTDDAFAAIFTPRTKSNNKATEVISTLTQTLENLDTVTGEMKQLKIGPQQEQWNEETDELRAAITAESYRKAEVQHLDSTPEESAMNFPRHILSGRYRPFNPPPAPVPMNTADSLAAGAEAAAERRTYISVLRIDEFKHQNGDITYNAHSSPFVPEIPSTDAGKIEPKSKKFLERMEARQRHSRLRRAMELNDMYAISVKRQRKLKMKKHKYKKLMRRTRNLRRRLDRN
ncbi:hypothetical protein G7Y89_g2650 [Cudoniella acicularis]|uniref:Small ribosomal subunit protein mS38 n=1 Tax=Cudoniella acicularis TaxID=354080 RepID=A0A8H4RUT9_9HELO|nr:hypothetical protein G7Y89_g2650 [Cudoniella acicularis]